MIRGWINVDACWVAIKKNVSSSEAGREIRCGSQLLICATVDATSGVR